MRVHRAASRHPRRGITAVVVLICLVVVSLLSGVLLKVGMAHRQTVRAEERRLQAEWLAQSGLERARHKLAETALYTGETWKLTAADLGLRAAEAGGQGAAVVRITVEPAGSGSSAKRIKVEADCLPDPPRRARHSLQVQVELATQKRGASR
jgi:hypothetical protein